MMNIIGTIARPVATGGRGGAQPPLEKYEPPPRLRCPFCRNYIASIGIEVYPPPGILSAPPANDTWLRR